VSALAQSKVGKDLDGLFLVPAKIDKIIPSGNEERE
jgi:hypothetical protein